MPIAGIIITLVLCYELISMLTERNNMHDIDTWMSVSYTHLCFIAAGSQAEKKLTEIMRKEEEQNED